MAGGGYMNKKIIAAAALILSLIYCRDGAAQQPNKIWRVGLSHVGLDHIPPSLEPLRQALKKLGYEEGKNIKLDWRNLADEEAANALAKAWVTSQVDLIVAFESQTARAAQAATSQIPIVLVHVSDPVAEGFGKSMAHPGGNITGFAGIGDIPGKRLELFTEVVPHLRRVLILIDPKDPSTARFLADTRATAQGYKLRLIERNVITEADVRRTFAAIKKNDADGVLPISPNLNVKFPSLMIGLAAEKGLPFAGYRKEWVEQGALFSYAHDLASVGPLAASYIDRILKGTKPADLPFQEPSAFDFVVSLKAAKKLNLTVPPNVLMRANKVIR
jgi:putative tryptophan/tyrosine transport system substrate-binding protein